MQDLMRPKSPALAAVIWCLLVNEEIVDRCLARCLDISPGGNGGSFLRTGLLHWLRLRVFHPVQIYYRLQQMSAAIPAVGNKDGSYLTAFSSGGLQYVSSF